MKTMQRIEKCIDKRQYKSAISLINKEKEKTLHIRRLNNLEARCLIGLNRFEEAKRVMKKTAPYLMLDSDDVEALQILKQIYENEGLNAISKAYEISFDVFSQKRDLKTVLTDRNSSVYSIYNRFMNNPSCQEELVEPLFFDLVSHLKYTETAILLAYAKKKGFDVNSYVKIIEQKSTQCIDFCNDILRFKSVILISDSESEYNYASNEFDFYEYLFISMGVNVRRLHLRLESQIGTNRECCHFEEFTGILDEMENFSEVPWFIVGTRLIIKILSHRYYKKVEMFYRHFENFGIDSLECLLMGKFEKYVEAFYGLEYPIEPKEELDFSIVIPARNSAYFLRYAIESCINQDYKGSYEILVSDNSTEYDEVKNLIKELNNPLIRYVKPPKPLPLAKSFEFAILNSKGKYILTIGSDDGLLPSALSVLKRTFDSSHSSIVHFQTVNYTWPFAEKNFSGRFHYDPLVFKNGGHIFDLVPSDYNKTFFSGKCPFQMMPVMYMTSCFESSVVRKIVDYTGKFEFGETQDIYTGIINLFLNDTITYIDHPVYVEGSSEIGIGRLLWGAAVNNSVGREMNKKYDDYRYRNYYTEEYYKWTPWLIYTNNEALFVFSELIKCASLGTISTDLITEERLLDNVFSMYKYFSTRTDDINLLISQADKMADNLSQEYKERYYKFKPKYLNELMRKIRFHHFFAFLPQKTKKTLAKAINSVKRKKIKDYDFYSYDESMFVEFKVDDIENVFDASIAFDKYLKGLKDYDKWFLEI